MFTIRSLTLDDLDAADQVLMSAYQATSRKIELERWMRLDKTTWLAGYESDRLVGTVGAIDYASFAYIGFMGVHADFQRRGYGKALMLALIGELEQAGQPCTLLDASVSGAALYLQIGYHDLSLVHVYKQTGEWGNQSTGMRIERLDIQSLPEVAALDQLYFGADRWQVLKSYLAAYPDRLIGAREEAGKLIGYALAQSKRLGPWAAADRQTAGALLEAARQYPFDDSMEVLLPSVNLAGVELLEANGFTQSRSLRHMQRGKPKYTRNLEHIYGQSSFMLG
jgi:GNAT superfamily N-acetyltransferase